MVNWLMEQLLDGLETKPEEVFSAGGLRDDVQLLTTRLSDDGYAFAEVDPATDVDVEAKTVAVRFQVNRGKAVTVDRIEVAGNSKTRDKVVRREMRLQEQEPFSGSKLRKSREALQRLGFFREVSIGTRRTSRDDRLDLVRLGGEDHQVLRPGLEHVGDHARAVDRARAVGLDELEPVGLQRAQVVAPRHERHGGPGARQPRAHECPDRSRAHDADAHAFSSPRPVGGPSVVPR